MLPSLDEIAQRKISGRRKPKCFRSKSRKSFLARDEIHCVRFGTDLQDRAPARQLLHALGKAVDDEGGRVDLLACSLLESQGGNEACKMIG